MKPSTATETAAASRGISWQAQLVIFAIGFALVASRRPDALLHAQFYAEDGASWYADAYNSGWFASLLRPYAGYLHVLDRSVAALALLFPFSSAPLVMNIAGIAVQLLPVTFLMSSRCLAWGSLQFRGALAFAYLALPNTMLLHASITESQWHLAVLLLLVAVAPAPPNARWGIFDWLVLGIGGLSGPFCLLLLPIVLGLCFLCRARSQRTVLAFVAAASAVQLTAIWTAPATARPGPPLGATPDLFTRILAGKIYLGAVLGQNALTAHGPIILSAAVALVGTALVLYCFAKAQLEFKALLSFCALAFAACLSNPLLAKSATGPRWQTLEFSGGIHYWFLPMLAFIWAVIWSVNYSNSKPFRIIGVCVLLFGCVGLLKDWEYPAFPDLKFEELARRFESAPAGNPVTIPLNPPGWAMRLTKKAE